MNENLQKQLDICTPDRPLVPNELIKLWENDDSRLLLIIFLSYYIDSPDDEKNVVNCQTDIKVVREIFRIICTNAKIGEYIRITSEKTNFTNQLEQFIQKLKRVAKEPLMTKLDPTQTFRNLFCTNCCSVLNSIFEDFFSLSNNALYDKFKPFVNRYKTEIYEAQALILKRQAERKKQNLYDLKIRKNDHDKLTPLEKDTIKILPQQIQKLKNKIQIICDDIKIDAPKILSPVAPSLPDHYFDDLRMKKQRQKQYDKQCEQLKKQYNLTQYFIEQRKRLCGGNDQENNEDDDSTDHTRDNNFIGNGQFKNGYQNDSLEHYRFQSNIKNNYDYVAIQHQLDSQEHRCVVNYITNFEKTHNIRFLFVSEIGSYAQGTATVESDIDLYGIYVRQPDKYQQNESLLKNKYQLIEQDQIKFPLKKVRVDYVFMDLSEFIQSYKLKQTHQMVKLSFYSPVIFIDKFIPDIKVQFLSLMNVPTGVTRQIFNSLYIQNIARHKAMRGKRVINLIQALAAYYYMKNNASIEGYSWNVWENIDNIIQKIKIYNGPGQDLDSFIEIKQQLYELQKWKIEDKGFKIFYDQLSVSFLTLCDKTLKDTKAPIINESMEFNQFGRYILYLLEDYNHDLEEILQNQDKVLQEQEDLLKQAIVGRRVKDKNNKYEENQILINKQNGIIYKDKDIQRDCKRKFENQNFGQALNNGDICYKKVKRQQDQKLQNNNNNFFNNDITYIKGETKHQQRPQVQHHQEKSGVDIFSLQNLRFNPKFGDRSIYNMQEIEIQDDGNNNQQQQMVMEECENEVKQEEEEQNGRNRIQEEKEQQQKKYRYAENLLWQVDDDSQDDDGDNNDQNIKKQGIQEQYDNVQKCRKNIVDKSSYSSKQSYQTMEQFNPIIAQTESINAPLSEGELEY